jgi:spore germination protein YaaH
LRQGVREAERHPLINEVILFAACFNSQDTLFLPTALADYLSDELATSPLARRAVFLSVVNDRFDDANDAATQKDTKLISRLMADSQSRARHKADLLALLDRGSFAGLELDYEKIDDKDWPALLAFAGELSRELKTRGKRLRFLLEPKKRYLSADLPEGPEYVLMAYNEYGTHSGPGPKASYAFLEKLASWCAHMGKKPRIALSVGGFAWEHDTTVSLTEQGARLKQSLLEAKPTRDKNSGYLNFRVENLLSEARTFTEFVRGVYTEVWYADGETLASLSRLARKLGFGVVDIWRLGGNRPESLDQLLETSK